MRAILAPIVILAFLLAFAYAHTNIPLAIYFSIVSMWMAVAITEGMPDEYSNGYYVDPKKRFNLFVQSFFWPILIFFKLTPNKVAPPKKLPKSQFTPEFIDERNKVKSESVSYTKDSVSDLSDFEGMKRRLDKEIEDNLKETREPHYF